MISHTSKGEQFTPELLERAKALRAESMSWARVAARLGVGEDGLRRRLDPGYKDKRNAQIRRARGYNFVPKMANDPKPVLRVPPDTRTPFQRMMGDPIPGLREMRPN